MKIREIGEFGLIERIAGKTIIRDPRVVVGIGDDAAVIEGGEGNYLLITADTLIEGVHFSLDKASPYQVGWKSLAVNASDIAAMGGLPSYALITLALPSRGEVEFVDEFYRGINDFAGGWRIEIVGGDMASSPSGKVFISICLLGRVEAENLLLRSGAKVGDAIVVSGTLGGAAAGFLLLQSSLKKKGREEVISRHLLPQPRIALIREIIGKFRVNSLIDISDGLAGDLGHILRSSGVGAILKEESLPIDEETREVCRRLNKNPVELALTGGEDYELLFTLSREEVPKLPPSVLNIPLTVIGEVRDKKEGFRTLTPEGGVRKLEQRGFDHFQT